MNTLWNFFKGLIAIFEGLIYQFIEPLTIVGFVFWRNLLAKDVRNPLDFISL